jgi:hypothetical protein
MDVFFQEKSNSSTLTLFIVAYGYDRGRLSGGVAAADAFKSAMQLSLCRRGR